MSSSQARASVYAHVQGDTDAVERVIKNGRSYKVTAATKPYLKANTWKEIYAKRDAAVAAAAAAQGNEATGDGAAVDINQKKQNKVKDDAETLSTTAAESSMPSPQRATDVTRSILRYTFVVVLGTLLLSKMLTETWTFGYEGRWTNLRNYVPRQMKTFSTSELTQYDGSVPSKPIYLALLGDVYDVSANPQTYGKGGSYNHFAGRDASRAFVTGCFSSGLTHDVRGLDEKETKTLNGWKDFFDNHAKYFKVGRVALPPVAKDAPIPPVCDPQKEGRGTMS